MRCPRGRFPFGKPPYAALWKSSIRRIQLVSGFHLGQIWAKSLASLGLLDLTVLRRVGVALRARLTGSIPVRRIGIVLRARLTGSIPVRHVGIALRHE